MSLLATIESDITTALKAGSAESVSVLRMLKSALTNARIAAKDDLSDEQATAVLEKEAKQRRESIKQFTEGGRVDLADKEQSELSLIEAYLPAKMSEEDVRERAKSIIEGQGLHDFGEAMSKVMAELKGQADGSVISKIVRETLG